MNTFAQQKKEGRSKAENNGTRREADSRTSSSSTSNRPEAIFQRKLQNTLNQNPKAQSQLQLQNMLNESPRVLLQAERQEALSQRKSSASERDANQQSDQLSPMPLSGAQDVIQRVYYHHNQKTGQWVKVAQEDADDRIPDSKETRRWILLDDLLEMKQKGFNQLLNDILMDEPGLDEVFKYYEGLGEEEREEFRQEIIELEIITISTSSRVASAKELQALMNGEEVEEIVKQQEIEEEEEEEEEEELEDEESEEEENLEEAAVSTEELYKPLTAKDSVETYNETVERLKGERKQLAVAVTDVSGEEKVQAFTSAIELISALQKVRGKIEESAWEVAVTKLNTAGAQYVKAMLIIRKSEVKPEKETDQTAKVVSTIEDEKLLAIMASDGLLEDPVITSRITSEGKGNFGWTNAKGDVGEFYGKVTLEELGRAKTKEKGGNRKIINVVVTEREPESNPKRIREIDGLEVEIAGKSLILRGVYEIKTTTQGKTNLKGELQTSLSKKWKALRDAKDKKHLIWLKEGEMLKEDITNQLVVPDLKGIGISSVGPQRSDQVRYDISFDKDVNKITDQLACLWLKQHPKKTIANVQLGTGKDSAFAKYQKS